MHMSGYQYIALKPSGRPCKGVIEADSERHARQLLRDQGFIPTQVTTFKKQPRIKRKRSFSAADLSLLTRQLATLLAAGIPLEESIRGVGEQSTKPSVRQLLFGVRTKVLEGYGLAQAMGENPHAFPELYRATIAAGEQTGRLDMVLEKLADYTEYQQQTRQKIQQAMIYPSLMIVVSTTIISFLLAFVVPKIIEVFSSSGQSLPPMTKVLIFFSTFIQSYGLYALGILLLAGYGFKRCLLNPGIRTAWHRFLLKTPGISFMIIAINVARYTHTFSILFAAGVSVLETMRVSASLLTNTMLHQAFDLAATRVKEGSSISQSLSDTHYLSPMAIHLIASGEKSGQLAPMMERAALHLDQEVRRLIDTAMTLLEPLVIILMGGVILFIVLATLLPIFSMEQLVT
jgi:general secretion pathway protein F